MQRITILQARLNKLATIYDKAPVQKKKQIEYRARFTYCNAIIKNEMKAIMATRKVIITIESHPDQLGRQQFFAHWISENIGPKLNETGIRGQAFFAKVDEHIARWRSLCYYVIVDDRTQLRNHKN